ncbi:ATP-binding protein [Chromobacterium aquaticum]|uniref:histidine kinase n=1 Tax=Chromobacterium aquaticum TaxID=467180 RepID=A0ABV8ZRG0_9NEIS|nr:ATP-binding protein [Chromobacterium aquaticum]
MRKLTGSLFFRLAVLVVLVVLTTQFVTLWMAAGERHKLLDKQLYSQTVDTLAFLEGTMEAMTNTERAEFLAGYNRPGLPRLLPINADQGVNFTDYVPRLGETLAQRLSHGLNEPIEVRYAQIDDRRELWVNVHVLDQAYWLVLPFGRYSDRSINTIIQAALLASIVASLLAFAVAWRVARPISRVVLASRELAAGTMPAAVPEDGPREVKVLAHNFNLMAQALDNAARERRLMLAGLSHDLRTPLTRLKLTLELQQDSPDQHDMLADIDELSQIVRQFIDFARAEETTRLEPVALADLAASVVSRFAREGMQVSLRRLAEPELLADGLALERLLSNLLENARRYGAPPVEVSVEQDESGAVLSVLDHGKGIPTELRETALAPFERLAEHRGTDGGSGLGLAIVSRVVKQHRGRLEFCDQADGFKLAVHLPLNAA